MKDGGWHFNNLFSPKNDIKKLKTFAHDEFSGEEYSDEKVIEEKINKGIDLFNRGQKLKSRYRQYLPKIYFE